MPSGTRETTTPWVCEEDMDYNFIYHLSSAYSFLQSGQLMCASTSVSLLKICILVLPKDLGIFQFSCVCYSIKRKESEEWLLKVPSTYIHSAGFFFFSQ